MKTLGLDLGGTKIAAAIVEDGRVLARSRRPTPATGFDDVASAMASAALELIDLHGSVEAVGVGSPGPLDLRRGRVLFAPNIPGMIDVPVVDALAARLGLPVTLENDANAAGYAEHLYGAATELESSIYITISTGIGGGLFIGNTIVRGANGVAGEIGHMTLLPGGPVGGDGHDGSWEAMAAGRAIARDGSYVLGRPVDTEEVFRLARDGEMRSLRIVDNAARFTGIGIANLVKIFDPAGFVIGGGMASQGDFYLDKVRSSAADYLHGFPQPRIERARLGVDAGVIGAASVAARR